MDAICIGMTEEKVRGSVINGYLQFIEKTWGKEGISNCKNDLNIADLRFKDGMFYPNEILLEVIKWISNNKGMNYVRKAGNHAVKNLGLLAYVVRFTKMETMVNKAKDAYLENYNHGTVEMKIGDNKATAIMKDVSKIPENCEGWIGAMEALLELTKSEGRVIKTKCQLKGDTHCEYEVTWE